MDFYETVKRRRSYRVFKSDLPEDDKVKRILDAARLAPTWANKQGMEYIVVKHPETVKRVWNAVGQSLKFIEAPVFIVGIISESGSGTNSNGIKYFPLDCGICFEHLILAATAEGLATCWIGWFNEEKIREVLEIPSKYRVMALTPLGYPVKEKGEVIDRKPIEDIVHYEKF
ncbi:MAG: nitroreductase family protein [Candidatus Lokiarchaeota archaeon]|nr:nitroreductase family protein [Candidatus Lokiarchaeota archaeon]